MKNLAPLEGFWVFPKIQDLPSFAQICLPGTKVSPVQTISEEYSQL